MATENITIFKVDTEDAVKNVNDLRNNIKILKDRLGEMTIGSEEYMATLEELKINQNAAKDAMYATTATMDDLAKAATGTSESYNGLVHRMAALKEELRATDISTEEGKKRFKELAAQINDTNNELKEMDALQGNFQRNVGNYPGLMKNFSSAFDGLDKGLKSATNGVGGLKAAADGLAVNPLFTIIGIAVSIFGRLSDKLRDTTGATDALDKAMKVVQPLVDTFNAVIEKIAGWLSSIVDKVAEWADTNRDTFNNLVAGAVGVGNAIKEFLLTPIRTVITAVKGMGDAIKHVFRGEFKEAANAAKDSLAEIGENFKNGFAFQQNFESGKAIGRAFAEGIKSKESKAEVAAAVSELLSPDEIFRNAEARRKVREEIAKEEEETLEEGLAMFEEYDEQQRILEERRLEWEEVLRKKAEEDAQEEKERFKEKINMMMEYGGAVSSIMGSIADAYAADEENAEKNAEKIKALRIASATIDTISGAVKAFMANAANPVWAATQAAVVLAAGYAQIANIRKTKVSSSGSTGGGTALPTVSAPNIDTRVANVRTITSASEEERLNQMAGKQRVYIVASDIQASQDAIRTQVAETSF